MIKSPKTFLAICTLSLTGSGWAADPDRPQAADASAADPAAQVALLKSQLAAQQKQIDQLTAALAEQEKVLDRLASIIPRNSPRIG